ncbi:hypothetical protein BN8_04973 [Fibrisoma limi BUZ 3]|uniref:Lipocalin-like domain-containing protein n=1 Tax=Fibrisoma limi BUZ 3 TaxID=1185876 RepID=I2GP65_9BACT|nr:hypothetical protein [Fibrisoma limi]CCH55693.1 hypothetical protein BN8_04973 [Fibrisoma limi BUZ 3]
MKHWLMGLGILIALAGCHQPVEPEVSNDLLYRTWQLTQIDNTDGRTVAVSNSEWAIVTFRPNGMILYGANGRYAACCSPNRFKRKDNVLDFVDVKSVPVPEVDNREECTLVDCQLQGDFWEIVTLTEDSLVLKTPYLGNYVYKPYP